MKPIVGEDTKDEKEDIFLATTYNKTFPGLRNQVESTWELLARSSTTRHISETNLKVGYRRPKNLRDHLVRTKLAKLDDQCQTRNPGLRTKCENSKCRYCLRSNQTGRVTSLYEQQCHVVKSISDKEKKI